MANTVSRHPDGYRDRQTDGYVQMYGMWGKTMVERGKVKHWREGEG